MFGYLNVAVGKSRQHRQYRCGSGATVAGGNGGCGGRLRLLSGLSIVLLQRRMADYDCRFLPVLTISPSLYPFRVEEQRLPEKFQVACSDSNRVGGGGMMGC